MINDDTKTLLSRRAFLGQSGIGLGALAATSLLNEASAGQSGNRELPHFPAKAKRVIYLFQSGGPSHIDLLDHSPAFERLHGSELPDSVRGGQRVTGMTAGQKKFLVCGPVSPMKQRGQSGTWMSDLVPHTADIADKITVINSMHTEAINHDPGITLINTGSQIPGRPSLGAWASYGLGSANADMPAYIVLLSQGNGKNPGQPIFSRLWGSGILPSNHQGVLMRSGKNPLLYLKDPSGLNRPTRREMLDDLAALNEGSFARFGDPEIQTRIAQYEMAFRMQTAAPEIVDLSDEPESTFKLYGEDARREFKGFDGDGRAIYEEVPATRDERTVNTKTVDYGIGLDFTPVVLSPGRISLKVRTSVSEPTFETPFNTPGGRDGGVAAIGLRKRLADTTVELPSGGSLVIAGLVRDEVRQVVSGFPGLSKLPILGSLFRSRDFQRYETELVVIVTPYLVRPVGREALARPDDGLAFASDGSSNFLGRINRVYGRTETALPPGRYHGVVGYIYK